MGEPAQAPDGARNPGLGRCHYLCFRLEGKRHVARLPRTVALVALSGGLVLQPAVADARPAEPFRYDVSFEDFSACDTDATLVGTVFLNSRSTGAQSGNYTSTFIERTVGTLTVGEDTYRYRQSSIFSKVESLESGDTRTLRLAGSIQLAGSGPFAGTKLEQVIHVVIDATGETRVDTSVTSFCQ
jgi:hypothetical protein